MTKLKALLVNPFENTVEQIEIDNDFRAMQKAIGCDCFTKGGSIGNDDVWCDDEGLIKGHPIVFVTKIECYPDPLAGNLLILGHDGNGESIDCSMTPDEFIASQKPKYGLLMAGINF